MISDQSRLDKEIPGLNASSWIAVDTEADSLHAYPEKLCLLQISSEAGDILIDTLAGLDLTELLKVFQKHHLIFHGADYDLRLFRRTYNFVPEKIFDTMTAARLLGYKAFGLTHLVKEHLGVELEKGPQKMNWARRPLTERMENYARNDTRYLKPLCDLLTEELRKKGRLDWQHELCLRLIKEASVIQESDPENIWRIKGSDRLDPRGLAILKELWRWREKEAVTANKPPFFVLNHDVMLAIARECTSLKEVGTMLPPRLSQKRRQGIIDAIMAAQKVEAAKLPSRRKHVLYQPTVHEQQRFFKLRQARDKKAVELDLDPTLIASRSTLVLLSQNWEKYSKDLLSWQRDLLSEAA
ncbi:MAG: ribonuclease D [Verrucomicrobiales bacterium]